ncbi:RNA polymerase sigma factor [Caldanaerobacter sp.]|uniref:RNA polymerase sigma factor n=1 Tax=Caldanaerobacter sp. TaxID=2930036 RepID=UPI003C73C2AB
MGEEELLERARNGDDEAFSLLMKNYEKYVYNVILRIVEEKEEAKDIAQETFIKAYMNIKTFRKDSSFKTWIYRIAVNTAMDYLRRKARSKIDLVATHKDGLEVKNFQMPEEVIEQRLTVEMVRKEISKLPVDYKVALILKDIEGMSYEEISNILKINLGTVKSRIWRARNLLRERIKSLPEFLSSQERGENNGL